MQTLEAKILISAADQASKVFGQIGGHARELAAQIEKTGHSFTLAKNMAAGWKGELESSARIMRNTGLIMTGAISAPIGLFAKSTLAAAKTHVEAQAKIRASLRSTGRDVEFTAKQLSTMAAGLAAASTFDDKEILEGTNALLKFGRIHGQVFEQAQKEAVEIAAGRNLEVKEAAETLGIALQDPEKSGRKLRSIGVLLSDFQKAQIHNLQLTGQTAKAQGIIMAAVTKAFAGQAKELADLPLGQMKQFEVAVNEAKEALGEDLAEALQPFIVRARDAAREVQHLAEAHTGLAGALGAFVFSAGPALTFLGQLGLAAFALQGPLKGARVAALALFRSLGPLGWLATALGAATLATGLFKLGKSHESAADRAREQAEILGLLKGKLDGTAASVNKLSAAELARQRQIQSDKLVQDEKSLRDKTGAFAGSAYRGIGIAGFHGEALSVAKAFADGKIGLSEFENEIVRLRGQMAEGPGKDFLRQFIDESVTPALKELQDLEEVLKRQKKFVEDLARAKPLGEHPAVIPPKPQAYRFPPGIPLTGAPVGPSGGSPGGFGVPGGGTVPGGGFGLPGASQAPFRLPGVTPGARGGGGTPNFGPRPDVNASPGNRSGWWTPERMSHAYDVLKQGGVGDLGAKALVSRWAFVEAQQGPTAANRVGGGHYGIAQWSRRRAGVWGNPDFDAQLQYALRELHGTEGVALGRLNAARTPLEAAIGASSFERAEGWNPRMGTDNWVTKTLRNMPAIHAATQADAAIAQSAAAAIIQGQGDPHKPGFDYKSVKFHDYPEDTQPSGSNLVDMFAMGGGRMPASPSQVEIGKGTINLNVSVDGPGKITGIKPQASGNFDFGDITVDRVGQRFKRPSGLR